MQEKQQNNVYRDKYGVEFQLVDMRWGTRDETTDDHMTTNICIQVRIKQAYDVCPSKQY
jgi:hypothetical protein